jgi:hypothetical protein
LILEFPPPLFLTTQPHLGDVSRGRLLTIKNFYELMNGIITPVQMEGDGGRAIVAARTGRSTCFDAA